MKTELQFSVHFCTPYWSDLAIASPDPEHRQGCWQRPRASCDFSAACTRYISRLVSLDPRYSQECWPKLKEPESCSQEIGIGSQLVFFAYLDFLPRSRVLTGSLQELRTSCKGLYSRCTIMRPDWRNSGMLTEQGGRFSFSGSELPTDDMIWRLEAITKKPGTVPIFRSRLPAFVWKYCAEIRKWPGKTVLINLGS